MARTIVKPERFSVLLGLLLLLESLLTAAVRRIQPLANLAVDSNQIRDVRHKDREDHDERNQRDCRRREAHFVVVLCRGAAGILFWAGDDLRPRRAN